jgi:hypothetical protein
MKKMMLVSLLGVLAIPVMLAQNSKKVQTIDASVDAQGNVHTATAPVKGPATVTCASATNGGGGSNARPATCYITGPGYHGDLVAGQSIGTSGAGTITLACDGNPYPLHCRASVEE